MLKGKTKLTTVTSVGHAPTLSFNYPGDDPEKGYITEYASDRPDKTDDVWDWLFRQKRPKQADGPKINREPRSKISDFFPNLPSRG